MASATTVHQLLLIRSPFSVHPSGASSTKKRKRSLPSTRISDSVPDLLCLNESVRLIGRLQLWNSSLHSSNSSLQSDCLAFVDDSATICCVVRNLEPQLLGRLVHLVSWNYIPSRDGGACLEIRELEALEDSSASVPCLYLSPGRASVRNVVLETPPSKQKLGRPRLSLAGCVGLISTPFAIPYGESRTKLGPADRSEVLGEALIDPSSSGVTDAKQTSALEASNVTKPTEIMRGFFLGLTVCVHNASCLLPKPENCRIVGETIVKAGSKGEDVIYIYFSGSLAAWRYVFLSVSGQCILVTSLRRKVLLAGAERKQYHVYAATRTSTISLLRASAERSEMGPFQRPWGGLGGSFSGCQTDLKEEAKNSPIRREDCKAYGGRVGSYIGIVSQMFVRGRLLELDDRVWLLLTHQPLAEVHGLRVGATVAALHVHFVKIASLVERTLLLAACCVSQVTVVCFSPFKTLYAGKWESQSCLSHCIESLPFFSAFWALQIIASFKQKFQGFYNDKDILGSMKNKGIAEKYINSLFNRGNLQNRDIFKEFFSHKKFCSLAGSLKNNFSLQVPPIGNFCNQIQLLCHDLNSFLWARQTKASEKKSSSHNFQDVTSQKCNMDQVFRALRKYFFRRVVSSKELGVTLLGFLQFSAVSRKLQLLDATGAMDVVIPDLKSIQCLQGACQVTTFDLVIEGYAKTFSTINPDKRGSPLSLSNILRETEFDMKSSSSVSLYVCFTIKEASFLQVPGHLNYEANSSKGSKLQKASFFESEGEDTGSFGLFLIIHKYPLKSKLFGKAMSDPEVNFSVEAIRLPYHVHILRECQATAGSKKLVEVHDCAVACTLCILSRSRNENDFQHILRAKSTARTGQDGYFHYREFSSLLKEDHLVSRSQMKRVLLQFTDQSVGYHEVIQIGQCYLVSTLLGSSTSVTVNAGSKFWSLTTYCYDDKEVKAEGSSDLPLTDAILKVPAVFYGSFNSAIEKARNQLSPILSIREVLDSGRSSCKWEHLTDSSLLVGSLVSFCGVVESLQSDALPPLSTDHCMCIKNKTSSCTIHHIILFVKDLQNSQLVKMCCGCHEYPFPAGLGQGAVVTIYRALVQLSAIGDVILHCLPSTLIVVCSVQECSFGMDNRSLSISSAGLWAYDRLKKHEEEPSRIHQIVNLRNMYLPIPKLVKVQCRVVSVERLVFEKEEGLAWQTLAFKRSDQAKGSELIKKRHFRVSFVSVTIDDGSGLAQCWATDETAACLLNFPTSAGQLRDIHEKLNSLVNKYSIILLQNGNFHLDCPNDCFVIQGGKDGVLTWEEERLMLLMVKRASHASPLHLVAEHRCGVQLQGLDFHEETNQKPWLLARKAERIYYERHLEEVTRNLSIMLKQP